ncbi:RHS repeat-associated core domain-containing protein [uncultured Pseudodesulfovibrio sp.]|uniref:RHS repeat domain-containing protein n=1 Tax=uncultured Pseudodesulfovibrio sp. TaxID=2035858 RepID=UPI0029C60607|nr:RHS repeat-associated core domain-containing protein [uncultured Pseudodesulfovibrio sp.]
MTVPYSYELSHDPQGRIIEKIEKVAGEPVTWTYAYDKAGCLAKCERNGWPVCDCWYDRAGRRACDSFPKSVEGDLRRYEYDMDNRLSRAGKNSYMHDDNGFRSMWNHKGKYTLYEYAPDYCLLKADQKDAGRTFTFRHDDEGRRIAKYCNGELVEAYEWLDFIRLAEYRDGRNTYEFAYEDGERTPYAMRRDGGAVASLFHDQVGSLRVVADTSGNVIKAIQYDPFGGVIEDSNPGFKIPLGFAGGLHDRDLGFVRFGFRDYDTYTSRWTAPDPIGDAGGDSDWYGYCLDDPVNGVDPLGLFRFGKRGLGPLPLLGPFSNNPLDDRYNTEIAHEHGFYEDGSGNNVGLFKKGVVPNTENIRDYELEDKSYDDKRIRRVVKSLGDQEYNLLGIGGKKNNCQDYADKMRDRYGLLNRGDRQR